MRKRYKDTAKDDAIKCLPSIFLPSLATAGSMRGGKGQSWNYDTNGRRRRKGGDTLGKETNCLKEWKKKKKCMRLAAKK